MTEEKYTIELTKTGDGIVINKLTKEGIPITINIDVLTELNGLGFGTITQNSDTSLNADADQDTDENQGMFNINGKSILGGGRKYSKRRRHASRKSLKKSSK
jgi:hypothetical protein